MGNKIARVEPTKNPNHSKSYHSKWSLEPVKVVRNLKSDNDKCKDSGHDANPNIKKLKNAYLDKYEVYDEDSNKLGPLVYSLIYEYIQNSQEHLEIFEMNISKIIHVKLKNEHPLPGKCIWLWHGTPKNRLTSIFKDGLQLPNSPKKGLVGNGIYFADRASKSAQYCYKGKKPGKHGYVLLCRVFIGKQWIVNNPKNNLDAPPKGYNSVHCRGEFIPDPDELTLLNNGDSVPLGETVHNDETEICQTGPKKLLKFNEYVVYNPQNVQIKYVVKFKFVKN